MKITKMLTLKQVKGFSVTWKRLNTETTQHENGSKIIFEEFPFFLKFKEIPQKLRIVEGFPNILYLFPNI